jgi:ubiquinone/menaquinone biosynthesis C-methylase UbiE
MRSKQLISRNLEQFYNQASEESRLDNGMGKYEFERVKSLMGKYIPPIPSKIIDVGGGTGKYAEWLAKKGHQVHMVEPVPKHLKLARQRAVQLRKPFFVYCGESRQLPFQDAYADIVILHGPLYHLQEKNDRDLTIREAKRVLKKGGLILAFAINYTASTLVGLLNGLIHKRSFFDMCKEELTTGIHNPPDDFPWLLAEAYYHRPAQLVEDFTGQDLKHLNTYAVEGMAWLDKDFFKNMSDEKRRATLLDLVQLTENDPYLLSFSPHMMIVSQKNGS